MSYLAFHIFGHLAEFGDKLSLAAAKQYINTGLDGSLCSQESLFTAVWAQLFYFAT